MVTYVQTTSTAVLELLRTRGKVEIHNVIRTIYHYHDERIDIKGFLPLNLLSENRHIFEQVHVTLPIESKGILRFLEGTPDYEPQGETLVFYDVYSEKSSGPLTVFYRPGLWEKYVSELYEADLKQREYNSALDNTPINDASLFPEYNSPDDHQ